MRVFDTEIPAIFPTRDAALDAVHELVDLGLADESLEHSVNGVADRTTEDDGEHEVFRSVVRGVVVGLLIGCAAGAGLVYVGELLAGVQATWPSSIAAGIGGSLAGIFFGSVFGAAARSHLLESRDQWAGVSLQGGEMLVVARTYGWEDSVREVLAQHGGRSIESGSRVARTARAA